MDLIITVLATWRLSSLLVNEDGPNNIFEKLRQWSFQYTKVLECLWCTSVWVAAIIFLIYQFLSFPVKVLAISAGAILVDRYSG